MSQQKVTYTPLETMLIEAFRRNPPDARTMIVNLTIHSADAFHKELRGAIASIDDQAIAAEVTQ